MPISTSSPGATYVVLCGGIGGAKLALGLDRALPPDTLTVIVNTGDDFTHLGFAISPDLDTVMYTLAGVVNQESGWGRCDETWHFMEALEQFGGETWFRLGDRDLATHVERTRALARGESLTAVTQRLCARLGVRSRVLPMSDAPVRTEVVTGDGVLPFQKYFVQRRAEPAVSGVRYAGAADASPTPAVTAALSDPRLAAIFVAPSNPWLSIAPMLAMPALRRSLAEVRAPVVAVSPIVGGQAIKGPTAKLMRELGLPVTSQAIAGHYRDLLDGLILDTADRDEAQRVEQQGLTTATTATVMRTLEDRISLARFALRFAATLRPA
jgi:LPPG:FO 2-phospho-L-lactate transferase